MPTIVGMVAAGGASALVSKAINKPDKSAQNAQMAANARAQQFIEEQSAKAERANLRLFDAGQENLLTGNQAALDIYNQTIPEQFNAFQQGNVGAQQQLVAGLPQMQNALMGLPVDYSVLQPQQIQTNMGFIPQQLPQFKTATQALALSPFEIMQMQQAQVAQKAAESQAILDKEKAAKIGRTSGERGGAGQADRDRDTGRSSSRGGGLSDRPSGGMGMA